MAKYRDAKFAAWAADHFDWEMIPSLEALDVNAMPEDIHFEAQRPLDSGRAYEMSEHFLPAVAAGVVVADLPDGRRVFVDGQHRWKAAKDAGYSYILGLVFQMSEKQAAAMFRLKNGPAVRQSAHVDSLLASREAAFEPTVEMVNILAKYDCVLGRHWSHKDGVVTCSTMIEAIYQVDDGVLLRRTLEVVTGTWGHGWEAVTGDALEGMALFLAHYSDDLQAPQIRDLQDRMRRESVDELLGTAKANWKQGKRGTKYALYIEQEILTIYNARRTSNRITERSVRQLRALPDLRGLAKMRPTESAGPEGDEAGQIGGHKPRYTQKRTENRRPDGTWGPGRGYAFGDDGTPQATV